MFRQTQISIGLWKLVGFLQSANVVVFYLLRSGVSTVFPVINLLGFFSASVRDILLSERFLDFFDFVEVAEDLPD